MRINGIWECPDADQEVGAKHVGDTERVQSASREPMPPIADEAGELGDLNDEPMCVPSQASNKEDNSHEDQEETLTLEEEEADDLALL